MATYDSIHTGEQVDNAVDIVLGNKSKGSATQPIYLDANGAAQNVNVDATPTDSSANLVQSGGVFTQLSTKYAKADISTDPNLGISNTVIPSQGAVKSYVDTKLATKQDVVVAGDGIVKDGNTLSISTDNDFMTAGKLDNKWSHFVSGLNMGYGTETIEKMENAKRSTFDESKFTKSSGWSGVITEDGIASGFSTSNYLTIPKEILNSVGTNSWSIEIEGQNNFAYATTINTPNPLFSGSTHAWDDATAFFMIGALNNNSFWFHTINLDVNGVVTRTSILNGGNNYDTIPSSYYGKDYKYTLSYDALTKAYTSKLVFTDDNQTYTGTLQSDYYLAQQSNDLIIGYNYGDYKLNLKSVLVKIDGVEVFSGNKTGIDTVKPDDWLIPSGVSAPTITNDGILISTDSTHHITSNGVSIANKAFKIKLRYKTASDFTSQHAILSYRAGYQGVAYNIAVYQDIFARLYFVSFLGSNIDTHGNSNSMQPSTWYDIELEFTSTKQYLRYAKLGEAFTEISTDNTQGLFPVDSQFYFGLRIDAPSVGLGDGQIDLNSVQFFIDGNLVYQPCLKMPYTLTRDGKKIVDYNYKSRVEDEYGQAGFTPYYTLNTMDRANYTEHGDVTIDSDWIASGFSSSNYITKTLTNQSWNNWEIEFNNINYTENNVLQYIFSVYGASSNGINLSKRDNGNILFNISVNGTGVVNKTFTGTGIVSGKVGYDGTKYYWTINGVSDNLTSSSVLAQQNYTLYIGNETSTVYYLNGSIDLKQFSITVDNKLAYQAVIPPNYTMATVKESAVVDSYDNGMNKWTKLANLTCKQQGSCTSGTAITFTKPYIDTNYALSVPYSAKTKTGFTPSATGDWIANGKVNLNA